MAASVRRHVRAQQPVGARFIRPLIMPNGYAAETTNIRARAGASVGDEINGL
jgi:hypothetical protein